MWEYDRINVEFMIISELTEYMNRLGKNGWEIIHYNEEKPDKFGSSYKIILIVKRKIELLL
jgi:hypothetical protein